MSTKGYIRLRTNLNDLENFVAGLKSDSELMFAINTKLKERCDPYVPYDTGNLSDANVTKTGVSYNAPYAHYQYTGIVYGPNYPIYAKGDPNTIIAWRSRPPKYPTGKELQYDTSVHPLAGPEWDKRMLLAEGDEFIADCQELVNKRVNVYNRIHAINW